MLSIQQIAAEISAPLCQTSKITMVSSGKGDVGAAKLSGEVLTLMEKMPHVVENLTGINITKVTRAHKRDINRRRAFNMKWRDVITKLKGLFFRFISISNFANYEIEWA